jgi:hypothetical protein
MSFVRISQENRSIPNQPWLSRRAVWLHKIQSGWMSKSVTPGLGTRIYLSSHERRARKLGSNPAEIIGALKDNTIRRIIHRQFLPKAMSAILIAGALAVFLSFQAVTWCVGHGDEMTRAYIGFRGLPALSPLEEKAGLTGQIVKKAGAETKTRLLDWFRKKRDERAVQSDNATPSK